MDEKVTRLKTPEDCEKFAKNVTATNPELAMEARRRAVELRAAAYGAKSEPEKEALCAVYAYEEALTKKNGKRTHASRTWQMIKRHGIIAAVERAVNREAETAGFTALAEMGMQDYAFEAVILRHPNLFSPEAVERSKVRMESWNQTHG
jgi:hypothetical protein